MERSSPSREKLASALLAATGIVHLMVARHHHEPSSLLELLFVADGVALVVAGLGLLASPGRRTWTVAGLVSASTAGAYVLSRTVGLPLIGHAEPWDALGVLTTGAEALVVLGAVRSTGILPVRRRRVALAVSLVLVLTASGAALAVPDAPTGCILPNRALTLYAEELPRAADGSIRLGWGLKPDSATSPGPLIELTEGDCVEITVINDVPIATLQALRDEFGTPHDRGTPLGISLHAHGVKYTTSSDGTMRTGSIVPPGRARTYIWYAAPRANAAARVASLGTAGYWWYHDHVAGTSHGTGGLASGLFGAMIVRRAGDVRPDASYTVVMGPNKTINMRHEPETFTCADSNTPSNTCFVARAGERIEFAVVNVGDDFHTFHLHAHNWANNRTGMLASQADETQLIDVRTFGPSETFGFQVIAGEESGPGDWMLHCHVQVHSDAGMVTFFRVLPADGSPLPAAVEEHHH